MDSDDEDQPRVRRRNGSAPSSGISSEIEGSSPGPANAKKQRVTALDSDEDEGAAAIGGMKKRISRFKKPATPKKARRRSNAFSDDDSDFAPIVEDSDADNVPATSSRRGSSVSRSEMDSAFDAESASEMSDAPKKKKTKASTRPSLPKGNSSQGGVSFLTAAEQRQQNKKEEKKTNEDAYEFLKDVRDVGSLQMNTTCIDTLPQKDKKRPGELGYDPRTLYVPPSAWKSFTPFEKQVSTVRSFVCINADYKSRSSGRYVYFMTMYAEKRSGKPCYRSSRIIMTRYAFECS